MNDRVVSRFQIHHLTCPVCGALPGTTCIDENYRELPEIHPSRRVSIAERNRRFSEGWLPPVLAERYQERRAAEAARAPLFDPELGPGIAKVLETWNSVGRASRSQA